METITIKVMMWLVLPVQQATLYLFVNQLLSKAIPILPMPGELVKMIRSGFHGNGPQDGESGEMCNGQ